MAAIYQSEAANSIFARRLVISVSAHRRIFLHGAPAGRSPFGLRHVRVLVPEAHAVGQVCCRLRPARSGSPTRSRAIAPGCSRRSSHPWRTASAATARGGQSPAPGVPAIQPRRVASRCRASPARVEVRCLWCRHSMSRDWSAASGPSDDRPPEPEPGTCAVHRPAGWRSADAGGSKSANAMAAAARSTGERRVGQERDRQSDGSDQGPGARQHGHGTPFSFPAAPRKQRAAAEIRSISARCDGRSVEKLPGKSAAATMDLTAIRQF